jgi:formate C-acetyltransferase
LDSYLAVLINNELNSVFGLGTGASADGRLAGEPLSRNLCAGIGRDKAGVTALIRSNAVIDHTNVPNGSVLDLTLHPTLARGPEGIEAMETLVRTYFSLGCFGVHINILDAAQLRAAQKEPEKYASLQVRVCGWNAYFVNLSKTEQNDFIKKTEALV